MNERHDLNWDSVRNDKRFTRFLQQIIGVRPKKNNGHRLAISIRRFVYHEGAAFIARTSNPQMGVRNVNRLLTSLKKDFAKVSRLSNTPLYDAALCVLLGIQLNDPEHEQLVRVFEAEKESGGNTLVQNSIP